MNFSFSEEQTLLRNSISRFIQDHYSLDTRRDIVASADGWRPDFWRQFADLGLLAAAFPEAHGGFRTSAVDTMVIMEEFGKGLVVEPYLQTAIVGGAFLQHGAPGAMQKALIPSIIEGKTVLAFAYAEPQGRYNLADLSTTARQEGDGYVLNGQKVVVIGAPLADHLIVTARSGGDQRERDGITVFLVQRSAAGISMHDYPTIDGLRAADITFDNVRVGAEAVLGVPHGGLPLIEQAVDEGIAALCAEAIGIMKVLNNTTVEFCKARQQFGTPIGKFQALQHRMVDMFVAYEQSVSMTYMVTLHLDAAAEARTQAAAAAKVQIGKAGRFIGQQAVQLHGGMGMTDELAVSHYFKRLTMIDSQFGNVDHHLRRYAHAA
jgi:pimeloyl-CoA dehydrogenase small subunit